MKVGVIIESDARPICVQLKKETWVSTVIGLKTNHSDCRTTFIISYTFVTYDDVSIWKFLKLVNQVTIKFWFRKTLA